MSDVATSTLVLRDDGTGALYEFKLNNGSLRLSPVDGQGDTDIQVASSWPTVGRYRNGQNVDEGVLNGPIRDLEERTNYLYDKLRAFDRNNPFAAVVISDAQLDTADTPSIGDIVYVDTLTKACKKALATTDLLDRFSASGSTFAVGMVVSRSGTKGGVGLFGRIDMSAPQYNPQNMVEDGETFRDGIYYLSAKQAGKITAYPTGPRVSIGQFFGKGQVGTSALRGDFALIHVESRDFSEAHVHLSYGLAGVPAGEATVSGEGQSARNAYLGYAPNAVVADRALDAGRSYDDATIPRLVFSGSWLSDDDNVVYTFVLGGAEGDDAELHHSSTQRLLEFGKNPSVYLYWSRTGASGEIEFTSFNQPKEIERGMFVELRRDESLGSGNIVLDNAADSPYIRTWILSFPQAGLGWRDLSDSEKSEFGGSAPAFVYNVGYDSGLRNAYPPIPASGASLVVDGVERMKRENGRGVYSARSDSVYWYDDGLGAAPWNDDGSGRDMSLNMIRSLSTETGPVVSLRAREGSGIRVLRCGTNDTADVGDLELDFDPTGDAVDAGVAGYSVVKEGSGGKFLKGPVVERIIAGSGIRIDRWRDNPRGQGTVVLSTASAGLEGEFEEVALQNAKQDLVGMFPYIRLLGWDSQGSGNVNSAFILKFHVPESSAAVDDSDEIKYKVHVSCSVFGTSGYSGSRARYAGIRLEYSVLPDLAGSSANIASDLVSIGNRADGDKYRDVSVKLVSELDTGSGTATYKAYDPVRIHTDDGDDDEEGVSYAAFGDALPSLDECGGSAKYAGAVDSTFGVSPGDTVAIRISRSPLGDGTDITEYTGSIGFMNFTWSLQRVTD